MRPEATGVPVRLMSGRGAVRFAAGVLLAALASAGSARGQAVDEDPVVVTVKEILVQAPRPVTSAGGASAVEARVDSLPLPAAATVEELLRELPLLHVRRNSRGEAEISARGSESRQVALLLDGVPVTLAWDARADVSVIPATALRGVTFTRGLSSMLHGPNVLGGVIEARTLGAEESEPGRSVRLALGADDAGSLGGSVTASAPFETGTGKVVARGGLGFRDTRGDPLARHVREPVETQDDLRLNTDAERVDGFLALGYRSRGGAWLSFSGSSFREQRGIAAELGLPDEDARLWRYPRIARTLAVLSAGTGPRVSPAGGLASLELSAGYDRGRTEIDSYTTRAYDETDTFEDGKDRTFTVRALAAQTAGPRTDLRAAFTLAEVRHDESIPEGAFEYRQRLLSAGAESAWRLIGSGGGTRSLTFSLGAAYDRAETPEAGGRAVQDALSQIGGRAGFTAVVRGGRTVLHAGASRRGRFPALRELYSGALNRFAPNPDLEPEKLSTFEAGATTRLGNGHLQAVVFHNRLEDAIVRITLEDRRYLRVNRDELTSTGLELLGGGRIGPFELSASAVLQAVDLTDTEAGETREPENLPEASGDLAARFPIVRGFFASAELRYTGRQFAIDGRTGEDAELAPQAVLDASLSRIWPVPSSWRAGAFTAIETRASVENATDVALYDAWGLPAPGRRIRFEIRLW